MAKTSGFAVSSIWLWSLLAAWLLSSDAGSATQPGRFPHSTSLTSADLAEAVALGERQDVTPYIVGRGVGRQTPNLVVYTPFLRLALAARRGLVQSSSTDSLSRLAEYGLPSSEVLVIIGSPCPGRTRCEFSGRTVDPRADAPSRLYISNSLNPSPSSVPIEAAPIRVMRPSDLEWLGDVPIEEPVIAATFNATQMRANAYVVAEWGSRYDVTFVAGGVLRQSELDNWRWASEPVVSSPRPIPTGR